MSYYTRVECTWDDSDYVQGNLSVDDILPVAEKWLEQMDIHPDVLDDVAAAVNQPMEAGFNGLYSGLIIDFVRPHRPNLPPYTFLRARRGRRVWRHAACASSNKANRCGSRIFIRPAKKQTKNNRIRLPENFSSTFR